MRDHEQAFEGGRASGNSFVREPVIIGGKVCTEKHEDD